MIQAVLQDIMLNVTGRPLCSVDNCNNPCNKKGLRGTEQRYHSMCGHHIRQFQIEKGYIQNPRGSERGRPHILSETRGICENDGCTNSQCVAHKRCDGSYAYYRFCNYHHKLSRYGLLDVTSCERCGWDKSYLDAHRIKNGKDGGKYENGNVLMLCANCHRIEHVGYVYHSKKND